jgi:hypothetical protein
MSSFAQYLIAVAALACGIRAQAEPLPMHLRDTGLSDARNLSFSPQYPLWSDGARKRRWIYLPPGTAIDASRPDAWEFPAGTRLWKEFAVGAPVETRFIERLADGTWRYATYVWNEEGTDATLAPAEGIAALSTPDGYSIAVPVTRAPLFRCWDSVRCSCRPIAIRSRRMRRRAVISISMGWSPADSSRICRPMSLGHASKRARRSSARRSAICTATAATVTTKLKRACLSI